MGIIGSATRCSQVERCTTGPERYAPGQRIHGAGYPSTMPRAGHSYRRRSSSPRVIDPWALQPPSELLRSDEDGEFGEPSSSRDVSRWFRFWPETEEEENPSELRLWEHGLAPRDEAVALEGHEGLRMHALGQMDDLHAAYFSTERSLAWPCVIMLGLVVGVVIWWLSATSVPKHSSLPTCPRSWVLEAGQPTTLRPSITCMELLCGSMEPTAQPVFVGPDGLINSSADMPLSCQSIYSLDVANASVSADCDRFCDAALGNNLHPPFTPTCSYFKGGAVGIVHAVCGKAEAALAFGWLPSWAPYCAGAGHLLIAVALGLCTWYQADKPEHTWEGYERMNPPPVRVRPDIDHCDREGSYAEGHELPCCFPYRSDAAGENARLWRALIFSAIQPSLSVAVLMTLLMRGQPGGACLILLSLLAPGDPLQMKCLSACFSALSNGYATRDSLGAAYRWGSRESRLSGAVVLVYFATSVPATLDSRASALFMSAIFSALVLTIPAAFESATVLLAASDGLLELGHYYAMEDARRRLKSLRWCDSLAILGLASAAAIAKLTLDWGSDLIGGSVYAFILVAPLLGGRWYARKGLLLDVVVSFLTLAVVGLTCLCAGVSGIDLAQEHDCVQFARSVGCTLRAALAGTMTAWLQLLLLTAGFTSPLACLALLLTGGYVLETQANEPMQFGGDAPAQERAGESKGP